MGIEAELSFPQIDADLCVHGLSAVATCQRCVSVCPRHALQLSKSALIFDEAACTGCGQCRPACPQQAITAGATGITPVIDTQGEQAFFACNKAVPEPGRGVIPCLHAISEADLRGLAERDIGRVIAARQECATCAHQPVVVTLDERAEACNRVLTARGTAKIEIEYGSASAWTRRLREATERGRELDRGRRSLFRGVFAAVAPENATHRETLPGVYRAAPQLDKAACTGCDACARMCPHGAIVLGRDAAGLHYAADGSRCSGCGLCVDVCESTAVSIAEFAPAEAVRIDLHEQQCVRCGAPFHEVAGHDPERLCRICRGKPAAQKLFEVRP